MDSSYKSTSSRIHDGGSASFESPVCDTPDSLSGNEICLHLIFNNILVMICLHFVITS